MTTIRKFIFVLYYVLLPGSLAAQLTSVQLETMLVEKFRDKIMPVRDLMADPVVRYAWNGAQFVHGKPALLGASVFSAKKVTVHGASPERLAIDGTMQIVMRKAENGPYGRSPVQTPMRFEVNLAGASEDAIASVASALFYPDADDMLKAIPAEWARGVPSLINFPKPGGTSVHGSWIRQDGAWKELAPGDAALVQPRILKTPEPEFPVDARRNGLSGSVRMGVVIAADGSVEEVWLLKPLGSGLDETSAAAARRYNFRAATYQGVPVATNMIIETDFRLFR